jgi:hypothetical protein
MRLWGVLLMVFVCLSSPAFGSIVGDTITVEWKYPNISSTYMTNNVVVPGSWVPGSGVGEINIQDGIITIRNDTYGWSGSSGFNGFIFTDISQVPNFTSFTLVSITGFAPPVAPILSFDADQLFVNFNANAAANIGSGIGQLYTFSFTDQATAVPLPGAAWLLGSGLLGLASWRRFRKS